MRNATVKERQPTRKGNRSSRWLAILFGLAAIALVLYAPAAQWWNSWLHARAIAGLNEAVSVGPEERLAKIRADAHEYNERLLFGQDVSDYMDQLNPWRDHVMGRVKIDKIDVDLPIYHTSSDEVLLKGAGHMEETTLPVGGPTTHAAITAHRGLAQSRLFTDLDQVTVGDTFTLEVLGEPLVYQVQEKRIVEPTETEWINVQPGRDLVTLITCDPLGINTERMLLLGERISPTPQAAIDELGAKSGLPGFPWWLIWAALGVTALAVSQRWSRKAGRTKPQPSSTT